MHGGRAHACKCPGWASRRWTCRCRPSGTEVRGRGGGKERSLLPAMTCMGPPPLSIIMMRTREWVSSRRARCIASWLKWMEAGLEEQGQLTCVRGLRKRRRARPL